MTLIAIILATLAAGIGSVWLAALLMGVGLKGGGASVGPQRLLSLAAGALLANRLSANPQHRVLLIEEGQITLDVQVDLPRPRKRVELAEDPQYVHYRKAVIDFLYTRQGHVEKAA